MSFAGLPFELLVRICRINAYESCACSVAIPGPLQDTIAASQVCRHWRSVIISAPELWRAFIDPYHPCASWRDLLLKRSEPLSIEFMYSCFLLKDGLPFYDIHLEMQSAMHMRLRKYRAWVDWRPETIWPSEPGSWPQLQHLSLEFGMAHFERRGAWDSSQRLPDHFPGLATPILEHLDLTRCYMPDWYQLRCIGKTLTNLEISSPPIPSRLCSHRWIEVIRDLPHLETLRLSSAINFHCDHPNSNNPFTLGIKEFILVDATHPCASFLNQIDLSPKCCSSRITCWENVQDLEASVKDDAKAVLFHVKRLLSQIVIDSPHLVISRCYIIINAGPLGPPSYSHKETQPIITNYSNKFTLEFALSEAVVRAVVFPGLLDLVRPLSSTIEIIQSCLTYELLPDAWDLFFEFLVQCQNVRFMLDVTYPWWKRICNRLLAAVDDATNDTTEPLFPELRTIDFERIVFIRQGPEWADIISFDDLKALCKHRASIGIPLERISMYQGIFEMDSSGETESEPEPWDCMSKEESEKEGEKEEEAAGQ